MHIAHRAPSVEWWALSIWWNAPYYRWWPDSVAKCRHTPLCQNLQLLVEAAFNSGVPTKSKHQIFAWAPSTIWVLARNQAGLCSTHTCNISRISVPCRRFELCDPMLRTCQWEDTWTGYRRACVAVPHWKICSEFWGVRQKIPTFIPPFNRRGIWRFLLIIMADL